MSCTKRLMDALSEYQGLLKEDREHFSLTISYETLQHTRIRHIPYLYGMHEHALKEAIAWLKQTYEKLYRPAVEEALYEQHQEYVSYGC